MNEHATAKEFALGMLTSLRASPKEIARAMVEHARAMFKLRGETLTTDHVHAVAGGFEELVHELQRAADELDGVERPRGPQPLMWTEGAPPALEPCPICKKEMSNEDRRGFKMIHAHCAPPAGPPRVRVRRKKR
jgi:hypothetical protein